MPPSDASTPSPGDSVGAYRLLREIGRGAMAVVFEATGPTGRNVALKVLLPEIAEDPEIVGRFEREGRILQALRHENIARVFDVGTLPNGTLYLAIELLHGEDLRTTLETAGPLRVATAVRHVLGAARGAGEAHAQGIVHRDLKPANLFLSKDQRGREVVKILDFGVAKVLGGSSSETRARDFIGSPHYVAPEQVLNSRDVRPESDVWALGVVLYEALTTEHPFNGANLATISVAIRDHVPRSIRSSRPDCPAGLEAIVRRCLSKDPAGRFATARELADALEPFASEIARPTDVSDDDVPADEEKTLLFEEGTRILPAAREIQKRSAIASLGGPSNFARQRGQPTDRGAAETPGWRRSWVLVVLAALLAAGVLVYFGSHGRWSARSVQTAKLRVTTKPTGALFSVDHGTQMSAPGEVSVSTDERPHVVTVWKDGFRAERREVMVASDMTLDVLLVETPR